MAFADSAWVDVLPSMRQFAPELDRQLGSMMPGAGQRAGQRFGQAFGQSAAAAADDASLKMTAALRKVEDAAGRVRVAEAKLDEVRTSGRATSSQVLAAEERLSTARRNETGANESLSVATRRVAETQTAAAQAGQQHLGAVQRISGGITGLNTGLSNMAHAVTVAWGAWQGVSIVTRFVGDSINAARDLNEEINKSTVVFGDSGQAIINWSKTSATSLGMSQREALGAAGTFGNLFRTIGLSVPVSAEMSTKLVSLAADLASFNNANPADVLEAMRAGLVGEIEPMRRFGVDISDAAMRAEAMKQGMDVGPVLTQSQKAQLAYSLMLKQTGIAQGDFARTSDALANSQRIMKAEWENARATLGTALMPALTSLTQWLTSTAIPAMSAFVGYVRENTSWMGPLAAGILAVAAALKIWTIAQALLNGAMWANPIMDVIKIVGLLVAAVITAWQTSETFRNIVTGVWDVVQNVIRFAWEKVIQPVWNALVVGWNAVSTGISWGWENVIHPAWNAIATIAQWLWNNVLSPIFSFVSAAWNAMATAISWVWDNVLHPVWNVISAIAEAIFRVAIVAIFGYVRLMWEVMSHGIEWAWDNILHPVWNVVSTVATWLWETILKPIFTAIAWGWENLLVRPIEWMWNNVLHPVWNVISEVAGWLWNTILAPIFSAISAGWDAMGAALRWVYEHVLKPLVIDPFAAAVNWLKDVFGTVVNAIESAWNRLKAIVAAPINFVIRTVLRDGLLAAWNWVVEHLGLPASWQVDRNSSWLQGINLAAGGAVPGYSPNDRADNIPAMLTANEYVQPVASHMFYGTEAMDAVRERRAIIAYQGGGAVWQQLDAWRKSLFPGSVLTSGYRATNDYHGRGEAIDIGWPGNNQTELDRIGARLALTYGHYASEIIHNPTASVHDGRNVDPSFWGASTWAAHRNHVHWAVTAAQAAALAGIFRTGMPPGFSIDEIYNKLKDGIGRVGEMVGAFGSSPWVRMLTQLPGKLLGGLWDHAKSAIEGAVMNQYSAPPVEGPMGVKATVQSIFRNYGWDTGMNWLSTDFLVNNESGWNPRAHNPSSSASGLFQFIDGTWQAYRGILGGRYASMADAPIGAQAAAGAAYIKDRYGNPINAWHFWTRNHWYGGGGPVDLMDHGGRWRNRHWGLNLSGGDERVLSPEQDDYFRRFVRLTEHMFEEGFSRHALVDTVNLYANNRDQGVEIVDKLWHRLKVAKRGGLYPTATVFGPT